MLMSAALLVLSILVAPVIADPITASHNPRHPEDDRPKPGEEEFWMDAQIDGLLYHIRQIDGKTVLVILDTDVKEGVDAYIINPDLLPLIQNGTACVGRYVIATGVRTSAYTLDAQGLTVDTSKECGPPPK
jgi:hypothetical protein